LFHSLSDFTFFQPVKSDRSMDCIPSPAAQALSRSGKVEEAAGGFARNLEKARDLGERPIAGAGTAAAEDSKTAAKANTGAAETSETRIPTSEGADSQQERQELQELLKLQEHPRQQKLRQWLEGLDEQELLAVLMQLSPEDLFRFAEVLGESGAVDALEATGFDPKQSLGTVEGGRGSPAAVFARLVKLLAKESEGISSVGTVVGRKTAATPETAGRSAHKAEREGQRSGRESKAKVVVLDLRKHDSMEKVSAEPSAEGKPFQSAGAERSADVQDREVALLFRTQSLDRAATPAPEAAVRMTRAATHFEQRFIPEFVKQTGIILKEGGNGEIRLVLKPENLGSVRIRLTLSESSLEGRIVVDNNSVKEMVESSLDNLKNALRMEGYQTTSLEVSVGQRRSDSGQEPVEVPTVERMTNGPEEFEKAVPLWMDLRLNDGLINVFA